MVLEPKKPYSLGFRVFGFRVFVGLGFRDLGFRVLGLGKSWKPDERQIVMGFPIHYS